MSRGDGLFQRRWSTAQLRRHRQQNEDGYTLIELGIALFMFSILMAMTFVIIAALTNSSVFVSSTYANENQLLPISTNLQSYLRAAVSPAPTLVSAIAVRPTNTPVPPFGQYDDISGAATFVPTSTALSIYTNVGQANGPALVVAKLDAANQFVVTMAQANAGTCPTSSKGIGSTSICTYGTPKTLITVNNVVSSMSAIFSYYLSGSTTPVADPATLFATCTSTTCPASTIASVGVSLMVDVNPSKDIQGAEQDVTYELSPTSQAFVPEVG
jgi:type II secretory pathway pseudopilin PulG